MSRAARVYLRAPERSDRKEFTSLMRLSREFHSPWATAPTDDERFAAYLADGRRPDFEAMLLCRVEDDAIMGFFNLSQIVRRRLQSQAQGMAPGDAAVGAETHGAICLRAGFEGSEQTKRTNDGEGSSTGCVTKFEWQTAECSGQRLVG